MTNDCKSSINQNEKYDRDKVNGGSNEFPLLSQLGHEDSEFSTRRVSKVKFGETLTIPHIDDDGNDEEEQSEEQNHDKQEYPNLDVTNNGRKYVIIDVGGERFQADRKNCETYFIYSLACKAIIMSIALKAKFIKFSHWFKETHFSSSPTPDWAS